MSNLDELLQNVICFVGDRKDKLSHLEQDVLNKIYLKKYSISNRWLNQIMDIVFLPKFRLASCMSAIIIGIYFGTSPIGNLYFRSKNHNMQNTFEVFSVSSNYLPSTILGN
jgi:hypothetical protein